MHFWRLHKGSSTYFEQDFTQIEPSTKNESSKAKLGLLGSN